MNITDHCRNSLHARLGIDGAKKRNADLMLAEIRRQTTQLLTLVELAKPRFIMGGIRYGSEWEHEPLMEYMQSKFDEYKKTGNYEMLVDFFNFIAIEGTLKTHPKFHFNPKERSDASEKINNKRPKIESK